MASDIELVEREKRKVVRVALTSSAKKAVEDFAATYEMTEYAVLSKLCDWFVLQDDIFQRAVMGMLHGMERDAARRFMDRLASGDVSVRPGLGIPVAPTEANAKPLPSNYRRALPPPGAREQAEEIDRKMAAKKKLANDAQAG